MNGLLQVPVLIKSLDELRQEVNELKNNYINGPAIPATVNPNNVPCADQDVLTELQDRQRRANNLLLFNVKEGNNPEEAISILQSLVENPLILSTSPELARVTKITPLP